MTIRITTIGPGFAAVHVNGHEVGEVSRDSIAEIGPNGQPRERYGWAAVFVSQYAVADPVRNVGAPVLPTRREAAEWLAEGFAGNAAANDDA